MKSNHPHVSVAGPAATYSGPEASYGDPTHSGGKKTFVLCFDGTGNKFSGTPSDSNVLKIYRMLDRTRSDQFHYYQPGIGTYVQTNSLDHTNVFTRVKSWYDKSKDSAVGTSFGNHVMAGYRFLMRYYSPEDDIYFFGFSRGAYTARFLAEMLDHIGLLTAGNEELCRFAWKTFSKWQARIGGNSSEEKAEEKKMYEFMKGFRETFSRPVRRLRFLGLFDTVNSVPRFESALMQRSKFPYTTRTSAKVIRHAVSINERRAKFRQDLVTGSKQDKEEAKAQDKSYQLDMDEKKQNGNAAADRPIPRLSLPKDMENLAPGMSNFAEKNRALSPPANRLPNGGSGKAPQMKPSADDLQQYCDAPEHQNELGVPHNTTFAEQRQRQRSVFTGPIMTRSTEDLHDAASVTPSMNAPSALGPRRKYRRYSNSGRQQDIEEVWFPGNHADIGGGWTMPDGEEFPLSHTPLVWMVQEAEQAGLAFDRVKMAGLVCCPDKFDENGARDEEHPKKYHEGLRRSGQESFLHDCLEYGKGLKPTSVLSWRLMEYLPFRRMDLKPNGMWEAIRWPLPGGETRDMPDDAKIHVSAIKRMEQDEKYRPGNLIIGGGGRGRKIAPKKYGMGEWEVYKYEGDPVKELYVRKYKPGTTAAQGAMLGREEEERNGTVHQK